MQAADRATRSRCDGFRGVLAFTLPEALWLAECRASDDIVVAYPTADQTRCARLAADPAAAMAVTVMVDSVEHLDLIAQGGGDRRRSAPGAGLPSTSMPATGPSAAGVRAGARRSPVRTPAQAAALARAIRPAGPAAGRR